MLRACTALTPPANEAKFRRPKFPRREVTLPKSRRRSEHVPAETQARSSAAAPCGENARRTQLFRFWHGRKDLCESLPQWTASRMQGCRSKSRITLSERSRPPRETQATLVQKSAAPADRPRTIRRSGVEHDYARSGARRPVFTTAMGFI